jgi:nucleoside-diphosphate-sugar epimerase
VRALVTGGGGYLGRHIARQLLDRGDEVLVLGRHRYPQVEGWGATGLVADLGSPDAPLAELFRGVDVVFHAAALPPEWAPRAHFVATNVHGTRRVIAACRAASVPRLVYTSTPSVTFDGTDAAGVSEADCAYPARFENPYADTKAEAERLVLAAHGEGLLTTALRPHLIYGPEEPHMLPRILLRNRAGRLRIVGSGENEVGLTYIDNAAAAHLQAADALGPGSTNGGRAYFVTDNDRVSLWPWINAVLEGVGERPLTRKVPLGAARAIGALMELLWTALPLPGEPPMTRFIAAQLGTHHWYDLSAARRDFGLRELVSGDEGLRRTIAWFREHKP